MLRNYRRRLALSLAVLLSLSTAALPATAAAATANDENYSVRRVEYPTVPVYHGSARMPDTGRLVDGTTYVPLRGFFAYFMKDATLTYDSKTRTATLNGAGLTLSARDGSNILYANSRAMYSDMPIRIFEDGKMYAPLRSLAWALSLDVTWQNATRSVLLEGKATPLLDGEQFYNAEDLYWLSRIISAESRGEPFIGQVAVGNVVLNRRAHKAYPSTVKDVVFDRQGGVVQFSPVADGSLWQTPYAASVTAAKVCLEGYTVSDKILFFYAPSMVSSTWIERNRPYAFTIASHRFFY